MTNDPSSIFDKDFSDESGVRRRDIMPLALKIYAWFYMGLSAFSLLSYSILYMQYPEVFNWNEFNLTAVFSVITIVFFPLLRLVSNLLILLEKKHAIVLAIAATVISLLWWCYTTYTAISYMGTSLPAQVKSIFWMLLEIPYLVILLKIRKNWERGRGRP
jgi:hypothetical protein